MNGMSNQHQVFFPMHQVAFSRSTANYDSLNTVFDLLLQ